MAAMAAMAGVTPYDVHWSQDLMKMIRIGGKWAVPRSGLVFTKTGEHELTLTEKMPFTPEMAEAASQGRDVPQTKEELEQYQQIDFNCIARHFRVAGVDVKQQEE